MRKARYIGMEEMEQITQQILIDYGISMHARDLKPIPIEELIEFHFELDILWGPIDHLDAHSTVMAAIIPSKRQIIVNDSCKSLFTEKIGALNFTLAHELGHWVLHEPLSRHEGKGDQSIEFQADLFAACLLMPRPLLSSIVQSYKWRGPVYMPHLYEMAKRFQVSITALKVRLEQLGLLYVHKDGSVHTVKESRNKQLMLDL